MNQPPFGLQAGARPPDRPAGAVTWLENALKFALWEVRLWPRSLTSSQGLQSGADTRLHWPFGPGQRSPAAQLSPVDSPQVRPGVRRARRQPACLGPREPREPSSSAGLPPRRVSRAPCTHAQLKSHQEPWGTSVRPSGLVLCPRPRSGAPPRKCRCLGLSELRSLCPNSGDL